jgi:GDP-L-fucose synthase
MNKGSRVFVAGHRGLVGSAIVRRLRALGFEQVLCVERSELDLTRQSAVDAWFTSHRPEIVIMAAAKVGGIHANNTYAADFIRDNLAVQTNVIDAAHRNGARKLTFLGSSCIYPKFAPQPMNEDCLLTGPLEPTNEWYAIAKIAGIKMCQAYLRQYGFDAISLMPTNLYGPGDNFDLQNSHVLPALMRKIHEAKQARSDSVVVWGTGTPRREFLYVDDLADAVVYLTGRYSGAGPVNVGVGSDITIRELAELMSRIIGFEGRLQFDTSKPDGTPQKLLDVTRLRNLGWQASTTLEAGLRATYQWFCANESQLRR